MARRERYRRCRRCGKEFPAPNRTEQTLCDVCRKIVKQESVKRPRQCTVCGARFIGGPSAKYCPDCRVEKRKERDREFKRNGPVRPLGSACICERCGNEYVLTGGQQKYCPTCSADAIKEKRWPKKRQYQKNYDPDHVKRRASKEGVKLCVVCGKPIPNPRAQTPAITCGDACDRERRRLLQNEADIKRGRRKLSVSQRYESGLPKSGVVGITARRQGKPWQVVVHGRYIGVFDTLEEAIAAKEKAEE